MSEKEGAAVALLKRAVELDVAQRFTEALVCYKEGLQLFLDVVQAVTDKEKKAKYRTKAGEYLDRSEKVQEIVNKEKENGNYQEHYKIEANSTGHSYEALFGRFLDENVTQVTVEDPYIRAHHQVVNFLRFSELCVKKCPGLARLQLVTTRDSQHGEQEAKLGELQRSLASRGVELTWQFSTTLHDREVRFNTGWLVKVGRGLDIYKPPQGKIVLGYFDLDLRQCLETTVDIFYRK